MLYFYFWGNCNHAGILDLWEKRFKDDTGLSLSKCIKEMDGLIFEYKSGSFFMPKFISDQYPDFPNSKVRAQDSAIKILEREGLTDLDLNPLERVSKPLDKGYGYGYDNGNDNDLNNKGVEKINSNLPSKISKKSQLTDEEFIQKKLAEGKKPLSRIDCNFTYITEKEYQKLKDLYGSPEIVNEMILIYDSWKQNHTKGVQANKSDYRGLIAGWAYERAVKVLQARQSPAVDKLRKQEAMKAEIQKNMGGISFEQ
jgi:hypothetical protein